MRDLEMTRIYIIDTSKLSGENIVTEYPRNQEFKLEDLKDFIQKFLIEKEDDFEYELDL